MIATSAANPLNPVTFGAAGIAQLAEGFIRLFANFKIARDQLKGFSKGGFTGNGVYRDETGNKVAGVVHENEFVMNKNISLFSCS